MNKALLRTGRRTDSSALDVLRLLATSPGRPQREMARELGMSLGKVNSLLRELLGKGFVKTGNIRNRPSKRGYTYLLAPEGFAAMADLTRSCLARKLEEYDALQLEIEQLRWESENATGLR